MKRDEDIASSLFAACKCFTIASACLCLLPPPRVAIFNRAEQQVAGASLSPWRPTVYFLAVDSKKLRRYRCANDGAADCCEIAESLKERD
jgi:hypothetical protein